MNCTIGGRDMLNNYWLMFDQSEWLIDQSRCMANPIDALYDFVSIMRKY